MAYFQDENGFGRALHISCPKKKNGDFGRYTFKTDESDTLLRESLFTLTANKEIKKKT